MHFYVNLPPCGGLFKRQLSEINRQLTSIFFFFNANKNELERIILKIIGN